MSIQGHLWQSLQGHLASLFVTRPEQLSDTFTSVTPLHNYVITWHSNTVLALSVAGKHMQAHSVKARAHMKQDTATHF
jgi:hypothetical protein